MLGNQSSRINQTKLKSNSSSGINSEQNDYIDEDYADYVVKNDIPEMKLLPMDYVSKSIKPKCAPPPPPSLANKCKCSPETPKAAMKVSISEPEKPSQATGEGKYSVYKKKHSVFGATAPDAPKKLQYVTGNKKPISSFPPEPPKVKEPRKRYLIFDSKKNSSKLDSIQYYFDNKSYEKYVDNKLYGNRSESPKQLKDNEDEASMKGFENSRSWEYRDNTKSESRLKFLESQMGSPKSDGTSSGASSCSEISLKRRNCRLKPDLKFSTSKSVSDLSQKTSHDVNRINQLFANAKPQAICHFNADRDKYKIHRRLNGGDTSDDKVFSKNNLNKIHSLSTDLKTPSASTPSPCGFKNCNFSNCPVSMNSASSVASNERRAKLDEKFIKKFEDMRKHSNVTPKNNEITVNKASISVNGSSNIIVNDTKNNFTPNAHDFFSNESKERELLHSKPNNQNKTTIKINESCFVVDHNNDVKINANNEKNRNIIELNSATAANLWDKNIKVKNNPQPKCDNKVGINSKIRNEKNSVKIYVCGNDSASPTPSATSSDSDKDYGYFDTSSQGRSSSPEFTEMFKKFRKMCNLNANPLGCDGAMFWNNSYFDDDETETMLTVLNEKTEGAYACTKCHTTSEDLLSNYICICRNQVIERSTLFRRGFVRIEVNLLSN